VTSRVEAIRGALQTKSQQPNDAPHVIKVRETRNVAEQLRNLERRNLGQPSELGERQRLPVHERSLPLAEQALLNRR
jgi:hypothetical protein